jgi:hypothetical protein
MLDLHISTVHVLSEDDSVLFYAAWYARQGSHSLSLMKINGQYLDQCGERTFLAETTDWRRL